MKQELLDLYTAALDCDDQSTIKAYQDAKQRIAPQIVMDLIFENKELVEALEAQAGVQERIFYMLNSWAKGEHMKDQARVDMEGIIAQVYGDLAAEHSGLLRALDRWREG